MKTPAQTIDIDTEIANFIQKLNDLGYAAVIFTPDELRDAPVSRIEEAMIERGFDLINYYSPEEPGECVMCNGTGEGQHEGAHCMHCHGKGIEPLFSATIN